MLMYVVATFEQTINLEMAISALELENIPRHRILAVPLDKRKEPRRWMDSIHHSDGHSMLDLAAVLGTVFMLLGAIYGYVLAWGPILWGIFGAVFGVLLGFGIRLAIVRRNPVSGPGRPVKITSEVVVLVSCAEHQIEKVEELMWNHLALGVSRLELSRAEK